MRKLFYVMLVTCTLFTLVSSCKKDKKTTPATPPAGSIQIWSNVHIIDSSQWILSPTSNFGAGNYYYTFTPTTPNINIQVGDILIGNGHGGYIGKVNGTAISGKYYEVQLRPATMADVFKSGTFSFQIPINDTAQGNSGITRTFSNFGIYHNSAFQANLISAQFSIQPTVNFTFSYDSAAGLTNFQMSITNATYRDSLLLGLQGNMPYGWSKDTTLGSYVTNSIQQIPAWTPTGTVLVPVVVKLTTGFVANSSGGSTVEAINAKVIWSGSSVFSGGMQYQSAQWQPIHSLTGTNFLAFDTFSTLTATGSQFSLLAQISSVFYGIPGPQITVGAGGDVLISERSSGVYFHHRTDAWSTATDAQNSATPIFGKTNSTFTQTWNSDSVFFQSPYQVTKISGDNQSANVVSTLPQPLLVKVTDSNGQPVSGVTVKFVVTHGGGTLTAYSLLTDVNGNAQVTWTLGPVFGNQNVTVTVLNGSNQSLTGSPAVFNATGN